MIHNERILWGEKCDEMICKSLIGKYVDIWHKLQKLNLFLILILLLSCFNYTDLKFLQEKHDKIMDRKLYVIVFETITNESLKFGSPLDFVSLARVLFN